VRPKIKDSLNTSVLMAFSEYRYQN